MHLFARFCPNVDQNNEIHGHCTKDYTEHHISIAHFHPINEYRIAVISPGEVECGEFIGTIGGHVKTEEEPEDEPAKEEVNLSRKND
jgi:hypothetical protein